MNSRDTYSEQEELLPIGEAARLLGVAVETLRRWDRDAKIESVRTLGGQRRFRRSEIERVLGDVGSPVTEPVAPAST